MSIYREAAAPLPIEDGEYGDFREMVRAVFRAVERLGEPARSADIPKKWLVGFEVGPYRWTISPRDAVQTCPGELREHLRTRAGRMRLAQLISLRGLAV